MSGQIKAHIVAGLRVSLFLIAGTCIAQTSASEAAPQSKAEVKQQLKNAEQGNKNPAAKDPYNPDEISGVPNRLATEGGPTKPHSWKRKKKAQPASGASY